MKLWYWYKGSKYCDTCKQLHMRSLARFKPEAVAKFPEGVPIYPNIEDIEEYRCQTCVYSSLEHDDYDPTPCDWKGLWTAPYHTICPKCWGRHTLPFHSGPYSSTNDWVCDHRGCGFPGPLDEYVYDASAAGIIVSKPQRVVRLVSFSYKYGLMELSNGYKVFDLRQSVRNPWRVEELRGLDGRDVRVQQYVEKCSGTKAVVEKAISNIAYAHSAIAFGCAGGRHRSVALVELMARKIAVRWPKILVEVEHRDINKPKRETKPKVVA